MDEVDMYTVRKDIVEGDNVHCLAFTAPLLDFGSDNDSDHDDLYSKIDPHRASAKKKWRKLYDVIMDRKTQIPLKQMAWKAKHETFIFKQM